MVFDLSTYSVPDPTAAALPKEQNDHRIGAGHTIACRPKPKEINCRIVKEHPSAAACRDHRRDFEI